jgi:hypothetical protein
MWLIISHAQTVVHRVPHTDLLLPRPNVKCLVHGLSPPSPPSWPALCCKSETVDVSEKAASDFPMAKGQSLYSPITTIPFVI